MSAHCSLERLSTYVDAELSASERLHVESHVEECADCRARLARLQSVVGQLRRLEQVEAPPVLGMQVERRLRLERGRMPLGRQLEDRLGRLLRQPLLAPLFAIVLALGVILYLFSLGVARQTVSGTQVVIGEAARAPAAESLSDEPARLEGASGEMTADDSLTLAGRDFRRAEGIWCEPGLEDRDPEIRIDVAEGERLPRELEELRDRGGTYRLMLDGWVVEVAIPDTDPDASR